jgi:acetyl/propionyl-CoA carboxylase alpha subunit
MRVVTTQAALADAAEAASREAAAAFGNGAIYIEKYLPRARHVEFQIMADQHGNCIHLLERECSIQRRHQKIIEETPSPALTPALREEMGAAAVQAARAAGYVNAGTVEFLLDPDGKFYFLEVNTRLQVEHPVTEMVTGIDMVREQIRIAAGQPLAYAQSDIVGRGHAIECRIYAEDPENDFLPTPGVIAYLKEPRGPGIRIDSGIYAGGNVPVEYDPILAKLIVQAEDREAAIARARRALEAYIIIGVKTPIAYLSDVLNHEAFRRGATFTDFIPVHMAGWAPPQTRGDLARVAFIADVLTAAPVAAGTKRGDRAAKVTPWQTLGAWRS